MVYTVIPYRLPQRPRWGLPRAVGMDSSGVRGQRASQSEESGGFYLSILTDRKFRLNRARRAHSQQAGSQFGGLSWTNTSPGNTDPDSESLGVFSRSEKAGKPGSETEDAVGNGFTFGHLCGLCGPRGRFQMAIAFPDGQFQEPVQSGSWGLPWLSGNSASFPEWLRVGGGEVFSGCWGLLEAWKAGMDWPPRVWGSGCRHLPGSSSGRHVPQSWRRLAPSQHTARRGKLPGLLEATWKPFWVDSRRR